MRALLMSPAVLRPALVVALFAAASAAAQTPPTGIPRYPEKLVAEFCASCHGPQLTGANAPNLLDADTVHGSDDASLLHSIRTGWPATGMPGFGHLLSEEELTSLVAYLRRQTNRFRFGQIPAPLPPDTGPRSSELHGFRVETVADNLEVPWGIAFLPGNTERLLVTERAGRLRLIENGRLRPEPVRDLPAIWVKQDGGLLDVALHPRYEENGWVYLAFSEAGTQEGTSSTVIVRGRIRDGAWVDQEDIFRPGPEFYWADNSHFGVRFLWDAAENLFYTLGDRGKPYLSQDLASPFGKIHRVRDDGRPAPDNPFVFVPGALPSIWTFGNRHAQGLAFHPGTGKLWGTEHGPRGGDELNRLEPGRNYGWPVISYGQPQIGETIHGSAHPGMEQPMVHWTPAIAPSGITFYTGDAFPRWKNQLFLAALAQQQLRRIVTEGDRVVHQEVLIRNEGRVRTVVNGPDGLLYIAFNSPGRIARLVPAEVVLPTVTAAER